MTIQQSFRRKMRRYALSCLMAASSAAWSSLPTSLMAQETHDSGELCGWIDDIESTTEPAIVETMELKSYGTCNYEDWLREESRNSNPYAIEECLVPADTRASNNCQADVEVAKTVSAPRVSRTSGRFNGTIATIAAATSAGNPVPLTQWAEPFAMVGPGVNHAKDQVRALQEFLVRDWLTRHTVDASWWNSGWVSGARQFFALSSVDENAGRQIDRQALTGLAHHPDPHSPRLRSNAWNSSTVPIADAFVPVVDFDGVVDAAGTAPNPEILLVETTPKHSIPDVSGVSLVGSSPIIFSIEEPTSVGEVTTGSVGVIWGQGLFGPPRKPFCIKAIVDDRVADWSPVAERIAVKPQVNPANTVPAYAVPVYIVGSAECLFDEWFWKVSVALDESATQRWLRPRNVGQTIATLVVSGDRLAAKFANDLAKAWPVPPRAAEPKRGAGAKLLARAEAAEHLPIKGAVNPLTHDELAQARAVLLQWVAVTQNTIDSISNRWSDVAEVALNRGTQDESNRR